MAISTFSILEAVSSASLPGDPYIRSGHDSREASCESTVIPQASCYHAGTKIMTIETEEVCENIFSYTNKNIQSNSLFSRDPVFNTSNHTFLSFQCHMYETRDYDDLSLRSSMKEPVDMNFTRPELGVQHVEFSSFLTVRHTTTCPERSAWQLRDGKDLIRPSYDDTGICPTHAKLSSHGYGRGWTSTCNSTMTSLLTDSHGIESDILPRIFGVSVSMIRRAGDIDHNVKARLVYPGAYTEDPTWEKWSLFTSSTAGSLVSIILIVLLCVHQHNRHNRFNRLLGIRIGEASHPDRETRQSTACHWTS